jgi:hypothetical protein
LRSRDEWNDLGRCRPVVEVVGGASVGMTVHLCFPRKLGDWSVVVLVALDVEACKLEGKTIENVDNATFDVAFRGQAVVGIVPRPVHGAVDPFDETQVVAAEERRDAVGEEDVKEPKAWFKEQESRKHAA